MSKIRNYYSKIYEKNPKLKLDAQKLFYKQLEHKMQFYTMIMRNPKLLKN